MKSKRRKLQDLRQNALVCDSDSARDDDHLLIEETDFNEPPNSTISNEWRRRSMEDLDIHKPLSRLTELPLRKTHKNSPVEMESESSLTLSTELNSPSTAAGLPVRPLADDSDFISVNGPRIFMSALASRAAKDENDGLRRFTDMFPVRCEPNLPRRPFSSYFSDGKRRIDFVLVYDLRDGEDRKNSCPPTVSSERSGNPQKHSDKRQIFENNLKRLGLELEYASAMHSNTHFVLIHAPFKVLLKQAELMNIKMPVHQNDIKKQASIMDGAVNAFLRRFSFLDFDEKIKKRIEPVDYFTQPFVEQHLECFVNYENPEEFFSNSDRSRMVYDFLIRTRYDNGDKEKFRFGIDRLVQGETYYAAYPLHDEINYFERAIDYKTCTNRQLLYETWVKSKNICKYQPLHLIKEYFGTKIGFYFAWLGYYTRSLYVVSILGFICVLYGVFTVSDDIPSNDVCDGIGAQILLCPVCDTFCDFTKLNSSCTYARFTYVFDNTATVLFAVVMSIWSTLFLEGWKRYHAELAYKWNVLDFEREEEVMRPEFQYLKGSYRTNPVTQQKEPFVPFSKKAARFFASGVVVLFFICLVLALVVGILVYRAIIMHVFFAMDDSSFFQSQAVLITSVTAALINLIFILAMNYVYDMLALKLTELECHRTQTEFDNSYTLKVFLFQFVNFYSSLFYIAFIKGRFSGVPAYTPIPNSTTITAGMKVRIFGQRLEDCDPAGCMVELVIQLFIIMCGKQIFVAFPEIGYPIFMHWFRRWQLRLPSDERKQRRHTAENNKNSDTCDNKFRNLNNVESQQTSRYEMDGTTPLYERDYSLSAVSQQFLFYEYLEMVLQFGFVTLFVAAFPLAPFFALLNNILEIRLDAYKFIVTTRRPIPAQAKNIGIWITILDLLSNVAVLCNAFVIAFTSDFIPKLYYFFTKGSMYGYVDDSLSHFDARNVIVRNSDFKNVTECRFRDYRKPPCELNLKDSHRECSSEGAYDFQDKFWIILSMRLSFVLIFELLVLSIKAIFAYVIPDMPSKIIIQLQRERYLARQAILQRSDVASRISSPQNQNANGEENLARSNDVEDVAFQPGQDIVGDDNKDVEKLPPGNTTHTTPQKERENLKRMYSNRNRPSLSPRSSQADLRNVDQAAGYISGGDSQFNSSTSLSPYSALAISSFASKRPTTEPSVLGNTTDKAQLYSDRLANSLPISTRDEVGLGVQPTDEIGRIIAEANTTNSSSDSFHSAIDGKSPPKI